MTRLVEQLGEPASQVDGNSKGVRGFADVGFSRGQIRSADDAGTGRQNETNVGVASPSLSQRPLQLPSD